MKIKGDESLSNEVERLRKLRELDTKAYKTLKTRLPYFVGSKFANDIRHSDNFECASYLTLDIDDFLDINSSIPEQVLNHSAVMLAFISPSGTGFKLVFKLDTPCLNLSHFKEFYKSFSRIFAGEINLEGSIDMKTCDATRACFLSADTKAYFNPNADSLQWQKFVSQPIEIEEIINENKLQNEINEVSLQGVLDKINPSRPKKKNNPGYVPIELLEIESDLKLLCKKNELILTDIVKINYGLKVQVKKGFRTAELNVFYGKKGYTIVRSPKSGTDRSLAEMLFELVDKMLFPDFKLSTDLVLKELINLN
jgi:hypothetical protein